MTVQFRILGPVEVVSTGTTLAMPRRRERCLLAVLLLELNRVVPAGRLADLLWDGEPSDRARHTLRSHVSRVRTLLSSADDSVELASTAGGYRLSADPNLVDAHRFRSMVGHAMTLTDLQDRVDALQAALALWRGPAIDNAASEWLRSRICADLEEERLTAIEHLASAGLSVSGATILPELSQTVSHHPGRERLAGLLMRSLHQAGRKAEALNVYDRTRCYLADELGLDPGPELRRLHHAILRDESVAETVARVVPAAPVPRQLPTGIVSFTGRAQQLSKLDAMVPGDGSARSSTVLAVITGTAGVGKSALAMHWAQRVAHRFPDGQLYVNLRGFDPSGPPATPAAAVTGMLEALEVPAARIPDSLNARVGLYRSLTAGRRMLILLDDVNDAEQVRALLPGSSGCVVVVTSRYQLCGLVAVEGARTLTLDPLDPGDARELLCRRLGDERVAAEPAAAEEIITRCARLPLALSIMAARAAARPHYPLRALAEELRDPDRLLDACSDPGTTADIRTVFAHSYRTLSSNAATLFRMLSLRVGPDIFVRAAASLVGESVSEVRRSMAELVRSNLVVEETPCRITTHRLLTAYSTELSHEFDGASARRAALRRLLDHYVHSARAAALLVDPLRLPIDVPDPEPGVLPEDPSVSGGMAWFMREHAALFAAVEKAIHAGFGTHAWQLCWALSDFAQRRGLIPRWQRALELTLPPVQDADDALGQAHIRIGMARALFTAGAFGVARQQLRLALALFDHLGHRVWCARTQIMAGVVLLRLRQQDDALRWLQHAYGLCVAEDDPRGQGLALAVMGRVHARAGNHEVALDHGEQALILQQQLGDRVGQAMTLVGLGRSLCRVGDCSGAADCFERALTMARDLGDRYLEVDVLRYLGEAHAAADDDARAHRSWQEALAIGESIGRPDAGVIRDLIGSAAR